MSEISLPVGFPCSESELYINKRSDKYPYYLNKCYIRDFKLQNVTTVKSGWSSKDLLMKYIKNDCKPIIDSKGQKTWFEISKTGAIEIVKKRANTSHVISVLNGLGSTQNMSNELKKIDISFSYPKPTSLIEYLINFYSDDDSIILDSFAGSGTTAHAVMNLNKNDNGKRKFILIEMLDYAEKITAERLKKVSQHTNKKNKVINNGFRYYKLGKPLFEQNGKVFDGVTYTQLAKHVFFTETGQSLEKDHCDTPMIGIHNDRAVYLLFNGILKDKRPHSGNVLTSKILGCLPSHEGPKVIYGTACRMSQIKLRENNITFKQVPYDIITD